MSDYLRCLVCENYVERFSPSTQHPFGAFSAVVCESCWPAYEKDNYLDHTCEHCSTSFRHHKRSAPQYCDNCAGRKAVCPRCNTVWWGKDNDTHLRDQTCQKCLRELAIKQFMETVPPLYRDTQPERLPCPESTKAALSWITDEKGALGLFLWGAESGGGKTRTALLVAREMAGRGKRIVFTRGQEFMKRIYAITRPNGDGNLDGYLDPLVRADLLVIDEADKTRLSERVEIEWFDLFEKRIADCKMTVLTSNSNLNEFCSRFSEINQDPVRRRLAEFFTPIKFQRE